MSFLLKYQRKTKTNIYWPFAHFSNNENKKNAVVFHHYLLDWKHKHTLRMSLFRLVEKIYCVNYAEEDMFRSSSNFSMKQYFMIFRTIKFRARRCAKKSLLRAPSISGQRWCTKVDCTRESMGLRLLTQ